MLPSAPRVDCGFCYAARWNFRLPSSPNRCTNSAASCWAICRASLARRFSPLTNRSRAKVSSRYCSAANEPVRQVTGLEADVLGFELLAPAPEAHRDFQ